MMNLIKIASIWCLFMVSALCAPASELQDPPFTHNVIFTIKHGNDKIDKLTLGLFGTVVPKTVANFVQLSTGENGYGYENTTFHRIIDNFMIQGGDIEHKDGFGGYSIYGKSFSDENFLIKHDRPGRLSMANGGPNTQGSQFFITTVPTSWLDGAHVVFGQLVSGDEFLNYLQKVSTDDKTNKPAEDVVITSIEVKELKIDSNANADFFEEVQLRNDRTSSGILWLIVFSIFGLGLLFFMKNRKKNLIALRTNIAFNSRDE